MAIILSTEPKMARWMMTGRPLSSPSFLQAVTQLVFSTNNTNTSLELPVGF